MLRWKGIHMSFTIASPRAVHLALASDMPFAGCHGLPATLILDYAKTFKSSTKIILDIRSADIIKYLDHLKIYNGMSFMVGRILICKAIPEEKYWSSKLHLWTISYSASRNWSCSTINCDDQERVSQILSPLHLICGRKITVVLNNEIVSTYQSLT